MVEAQKFQQVRVGAVDTDAAYGALLVAKDKRFYEKYGFDVQLILVNSGSLVAQMFQAGKFRSPPMRNMHGSKLHYHNTGLTVKKDYAAANPKAVDGLPARRLKRTAMFLEKRTNSL